MVVEFRRSNSSSSILSISFSMSPPAGPKNPASSGVPIQWRRYSIREPSSQMKISKTIIAVNFLLTPSIGNGLLNASIRGLFLVDLPPARIMRSSGNHAGSAPDAWRHHPCGFSGRRAHARRRWRRTPRDLGLGQAGEGHPQVGRAQGDGPDPVLVQQPVPDGSASASFSRRHMK